MTQCDLVHFLENVLTVEQNISINLTIFHGSFIRFGVFRNVDFPHPEGPINAVILFASIFIFTSLSAWKSP